MIGASYEELAGIVEDQASKVVLNQIFFQEDMQNIFQMNGFNSTFHISPNLEKVGGIFKITKIVNKKTLTENY